MLPRTVSSKNNIEGRLEVTAEDLRWLPLAAGCRLSSAGSMGNMGCWWKKLMEQTRVWRALAVETVVEAGVGTPEVLWLV